MDTADELSRRLERLKEGRVRGRVTSFDVAELAGVSQSTVSRALSGARTITETTRRKVEEAAAALNYHVDERAAQLRSGRSKILAVVVIARPGEPASQLNPFAFSLLGSICTSAAARGMQTLVSFQANESEFYGHYVERGQAEGTIVIGTTVNIPAWNYFEKIARDASRMVFWGSPFDDLEWVRSDNHHGGQIATERLLSAGARDIAFVGPVSDRQDQFRERYDAYCEAISAAGLSSWLVDVDSALDRAQQGRTGITQILASGRRCDGIFAACDSIAFGALDCLREAQVEIPGAIGLIGFDGLSAGELTNPPLTTIAPDFVAAGELLVDSVLGEMADSSRPQRAKHTHQRAPVRLVERLSVGPIVQPARIAE